MATVHAIVEFFSELKPVFWKKLSSSKSWYFDIVMLAGVLSLSRLSNHRGKAITVVFALAGLLTLRLATSPRAWDGNAIGHFHKWRPLLHSFVFMLIRPTALVLKQIFF